MTEEPLDDLIARLERERLEADRLYQEALTALDRAVTSAPGLPAPPDSPDGSRLASLNRLWKIAADGPPDAGRSLAGRLRAFVWHVVGRALEEQRVFNAAVVDQLNRSQASTEEVSETVKSLIDVLRREGAHRAQFEWLLLAYLRTVTLYVDTKDRSSGASELRDRLALAEQRIQVLKRALEGSPASAAPAPLAGSPAFASRVDSPAYVGFEDRFRGSEQDVRGRAEKYLPLLSSASDVVDVGCGRGEMLDLLRTRGIAARGVDANHAMVALCRSRGLAVDESDAVTYLAGQPDGSIGGLVAVQVVEHFEPAYLVAFLETAFHKLRSGAPIILETINPACWMAFFETYLRDVTHVRPLHPDTLRYLVETSGFRAVDVRFRHPVPESDRLPRVPVGDNEAALGGWDELAAALNRQADLLNARLFSFTDYAVIAKR